MAAVRIVPKHLESVVGKLRHGRRSPEGGGDDAARSSRRSPARLRPLLDLLPKVTRAPVLTDDLQSYQRALRKLDGLPPRVLLDAFLRAAGVSKRGLSPRALDALTAVVRDAVKFEVAELTHRPLPVQALLAPWLSGNANPQRILLDSDLTMGAMSSDGGGTEIDDGFAVAFALAHPGLVVDLITTVAGNGRVEHSTYLTRRLLAQLDHPEISVIGGAERPLLRERETPVATDFEIPEDYRTESASVPGVASDAIIDRAMAAPGELTMVCIGPLTNIASALQKEPKLAAALKEIVIMGGLFKGHTHDLQEPGEFNIWVDPDAARIVLESGAKLRFVGLDATLKVRLTEEHAARMEESGSPFGQDAARYARAWIAAYERDHPGNSETRGSCGMHDPLALAAVLHPQLLHWEQARVEVEAESRRTRGVMVADLLQGKHPPTPNALIATDVNVQAFMDLFLHLISAERPSS